jgi:opacity protein-like surface antigen
MIRTGCGLTRAQDDGNYAVTYQKYEQVGFYVDITSFTGIEGYPDSVVFETRVVEVYDTVYHNDQVMTDNSYTYLQVPLQAGYRFFAAKRLSVYAMAGPAFTYLLNENKSAPVYESYGAQNVSVDDNTPVRSKFSWQLLFGLGAEYKITDKISISAEPTFRQYFKTAYEGNPTQKLPYSWGVRAGIHFNF